MAHPFSGQRVSHASPAAIVVFLALPAAQWRKDVLTIQQVITLSIPIFRTKMRSTTATFSRRAESPFRRAGSHRRVLGSEGREFLHAHSHIAIVTSR